MNRILFLCLFVTLHVSSDNRLGQLHFYDLFERYYPQWYEKAFSNKPQEYWMYKQQDTIKAYADFLNALFEKNYNSSEPQKNSPNRIPPIIHQIWLGPPLPEECKILQKTWLDRLPKDWTYKLWTEKEIDAFGLHNQELYNNAKNFAQKSDIARYEILLREGGLYVDLDCACFRFDDIIRYHKQYDFYAGVEPTFYNFMIGNAVIGSVPGHPILKNMVNKMKTWFNFVFSYTTQADMPAWLFTSITTGPGFFSAAIWDQASKYDHKNIIFTPSFFYPFISQKEAVPVKETCIVHHFHNSWFSD